MSNDNEKYFLNNLYSDNIIASFVGLFRTNLYTDIMKEKVYLQDNKLFTGDVEDITIDNNINIEYNIPEGSYYLRLPSSALPIQSDILFTQNYGYFNQISFTDILADTDTFSHSVFFAIGDGMIYNAKFVLTKQELYIFISNESSTDSINGLITSNAGKQWSLYYGPTTTYYTGYMLRTNLFNNGKIMFDTLAKHKESKFVSSGHWTLYATSNALNTNIMAACPVIYDEENSCFNVPGEFISYISTITAMIRCLIVNDADVTGAGYYINNSGSSPIFQIPYDKTPIPVENFMIWAYDSSRKKKMYRVPTEGITIQYPNVYDFSSVIGENDLYIEWIERAGEVTELTSYIQHYLNFYESKYPELLHSGGLNPHIEAYKPLGLINFTTEDYLASKYFGDSRKWALEKLVTILQDNPNRYDDLYHILYNNIKRRRSQSYTIRTNPEIYQRSVMSSINSENTFKEPYSYIIVQSPAIEKDEICLYINGIRIESFIVDANSNEHYVYFPASLISNNEDIMIDMVRMDNDTEDQLIKNVDSNEFYRFHQLTSVRPSDIGYYDNDTKEWIDPKKVTYRIYVQSLNVVYTGKEEIETIDILNAGNASLDSLYVPENYEHSVLTNSESFIEINGNESHVMIPSDLIAVNFADDSYNGKSIGITNCNFNRVDTLHVGPSDVAVKITDVKGIPDKNRYKLYVDGKLLSPIDYELDFSNKYNDRLIIYNLHFDKECELKVEYVGYDEECVFVGALSSLSKTYDNVIYLDNILPTPFSKSMYKIYIDGYRLHNNQIVELGYSNILVFDSYNENINPLSQITIYRQVTDEDPYRYNEAQLYMTDVVLEDKDLRKYLLDLHDLYGTFKNPKILFMLDDDDPGIAYMCNAYVNYDYPNSKLHIKNGLFTLDPETNSVTVKRDNEFSNYINEMTYLLTRKRSLQVRKTTIGFDSEAQNLTIDYGTFNIDKEGNVISIN